MTSHVLLEGILDVKDPRGSEDRKFWKAWRRQWVSISVIYPSGRREPHLLLNLSHCSSESPERQIRIQRDGLRLFRCRSKSRPYRTWAIMSGDKLVHYLAAESEIQAQIWMQEVRNGLWPSCFSFQMLTAYSHEVSLIDDENTFLSGLLGVYGRFVLTSEDVISLMHPHWGSISLQISLNNVEDILFIREAETPPAGVFSIILKKKEDSKVKALQFFCNTAMDAIQWILSKVFAKTNGRSNEIAKEKLSVEPSSFHPDMTIPQENNIRINLKSGNTDSSNIILSQRTHDININSSDSNTDYENLQHLKENCTLQTGQHLEITDHVQNVLEYSKTNKINSLKDASENLSWTDSRTSDSSLNATDTGDNQHLVSKFPNSKPSEDHLYTNVADTIDYKKVKPQNYYNSVDGAAITDDLGTKSDTMNISNENFDLGKKLQLETPNDSFVTYSTVHKNVLKDSFQRMPEEEFLTDEYKRKENITNNHSETENSELSDTELSTKPSPSKSDSKNYSNDNSANKVISNYSSFVKRSECEKSMYANVDFPPKNDLPAFNFLHDSNSVAYGEVNKQKHLSNSSEKRQTVQFFTNTLSINKNSNAENVCFLSNIPSDFLNTSITNSIKFKNKMNSECSSSDEDTESNDIDFNDRVYETILDRRGTIYEHIDASDSEDESTFELPPVLPARPENLEIPESLRLQKLSNSIQQTLNVMDNTKPPTKGYPRLTHIKKIKDTSRIMKINPNQESSRDSFTVETKFSAKAKNMSILTPTISNPLQNIDNVGDELNVIFEPRSTDELNVIFEPRNTN